VLVHYSQCFRIGSAFGELGRSGCVFGGSTIQKVGALGFCILVLIGDPKMSQPERFDVYGSTVLLDLHNCDASMFTRMHIRKFMKDFCEKFGFTRARLHFWDYDNDEERRAAPAHLAGVSAVQFLTTSGIVIHTIDKLQAVYLDIFWCGISQSVSPIHPEYIDMQDYAAAFFRGTPVVNTHWRGLGVYKSAGLLPPAISQLQSRKRT